MSCHVAVPSSTTLVTMRCRSSLSSEARMSSVRLTLSFCDLHKLSRYFSLWGPLALLPSILLVTTRFSSPCFLGSTHAPGRICFSRVRCTSASLNAFRYFSSPSTISLTSYARNKLQWPSTCLLSLSKLSMFHIHTTEPTRYNNVKHIVL